MSRRNVLMAEVRLAMERVSHGPDPRGLGYLPPAAFQHLVDLAGDVNSLAHDLTTAKFLWHWDSMGRTLDHLIMRLQTARDGATARRALSDLLGLLTDEDRWR